MKHYLFTALFFVGVILNNEAKEISNVHRIPAPPNTTMAGCAPSKSRADLDVNNVRTPIWINGDMWWDLVGNALYEVPVGSGKHSLFAGGIWIGGKDASGSQLKMAAQTYRQSGSDFWPGPIDQSTVSITPGQCLYYDHHYKITKAEVIAFHQEYQINNNTSYDIPDVIKNWPGNGNPAYHEASPLAPFYDRSGDGIYNYDDGDYPKFNIDGSLNPCDKDLLLGDQTIWWVFNDVGNIHAETQSVNRIGIEIHAQAFGFNTNDEVNNMTFYRYKIINRATTILKDTYFGSWVDPDLGNYLDDFVGCDVARGLGYCYNGDADDDGALGYGQNPPAIGLDFFEGPLADTSDNLDNDRDGIVDEIGEQIIMAKFVYYNNDFTDIGNPVTAQDYYGYLDGVWKDGTPLRYGADGHNGTGDSCDFMFPGDSDPLNIGTHGIAQTFEWTETEPTAGGTPNVPSDRRFLQSAGKFTLYPGDVNFITTGAVWARTSSGGPEASIKLLKIADVKAQNLFEACFKLMDGPDAPDLSIRELDKEIIISLSNNPALSNNAKEGYTEKDINIPLDSAAVYVFEGYKVYQVKDASITVNDLKNADKARLIFQSDIKNGVSQIVNKVLDGDLNAYVPTEEVSGADKGLRHSFRLTTDAFATGDSRLINHKTYYFLAVAYAYDPIADVLDPYDPQRPFPGLYGQPYIQSRKGGDGTAVSVYTAIPHIPAPEANGLELSSSFGDGPEITRVTGIGNGYIRSSDRSTIDMNQSQVESILFNQSNPTNRVLFPTYARARGPVDIRIYDPVRIPSADFQLWLADTTSTAHWVLKNLTTGQIDTSEKSLSLPYDELFPEYGFYISLNQVKGPGEDQVGGNGAIEGTLSFKGDGQWLGFIPDIDNFPQFNWILSGNNTDPTLYAPPDYDGLDGSQFYEKILGGTWAPFKLVSRMSSGVDYVAPAPFLSGTTQPQEYDSLSYLGSVDIVFTNDPDKWSKCVVFEMGNDPLETEGGQGKNLLRKHASLNKDGSYSSDPNDYGRGWFPGYAINVETGERLNIAYSEASNLPIDNGTDMKWNPTERQIGFTTDTLNPIELFAGGKHYIYVFGHKAPENPTHVQDTSYYGPAYDSCNYIYSKLYGVAPPVNSAQARKKVQAAWRDCMWVGCPLKTPGQTLLSSEARVRLRVSKPYRYYDTGIQGSVNNNLPFYTFNTFGLVAKVNQPEVAKNALSLINIVPNPYYAYSNYEGNQLDNRVKIVNLPPKCQITIYSTSGSLVRRFKRDVSAVNNGDYNTAGVAYPETNVEAAVDWDLKNELGIPIASGMYLIHVTADGVGERTLKWFGVMRPIDLDTF